MYSASQFRLFLKCTKAFALATDQNITPRKSESELIQDISKRQMVDAYIRETGIDKIGAIKRKGHISELLSGPGYIMPKGQIQIRKGLILAFDLVRVQNGGITIYYFNLKHKREFPELDQDLVNFEYNCWILSLLLGVPKILLINQVNPGFGEASVFYGQDITDRIKFHFQNKIKPTYRAAKQVPKDRSAIQFRFGAHCGLATEHQCQFLKSCHKINQPNHLLSYRGVFTRHRYSLVSRKVETLDQIPLSVDYKKHEYIIQNHPKGSEDHIDKKAIQKWLKAKDHDLRIDKLDTPLIFMDFEAFDFEYPIRSNWDIRYKVPFQFSIHILYPQEQKLIMEEFLDIGEGIPHLDFLTKLLAYCREPLVAGARTIVYNKTFEIGVLKGLQEQFPEKHDEIQKLIDSMVDLMTPFRKRYFYSGSQMGSYSLKEVYPAIRQYVPESERLAKDTYTNMRINSGLSAVLAYARLQSRYTETKEGAWQGRVREGIIRDMKSYCGLDTLSMYEILVGLTEMAKS